jgi:hypothetical protein
VLPKKQVLTHWKGLDVPGRHAGLGSLDDIDAARCDWFIESIMKEREMWPSDAARVSSSTSF